MPATTTSVLAYSFLTAFTKNIPLTIFILVTLFVLTIFVIYKATKLVRVRRDHVRWIFRRELVLDLESKPASNENSSSNVESKPPPISHLRPKTGDRIRFLHRRLITSSGSAEPIYLPFNIGRDSTNDSGELSTVHELINGCREPSTISTERPSSLLLYGSKPGLDLGKYEGGYEEGVLQTALIRCMLRRPSSSVSFLPL